MLDLEGPSTVDQGAALVQQIEALIRSGEREFLLNAERLFSIDSTGLGDLVRSHQLIEGNQGRVVLVNLNERIRRYLATTGLLAFLKVADTEAAPCANNP